MALAVPASSARPTYRTAAIIAAATALVVASALALLWPAGRGLVLYGLYAIPAHLLISVVANEPVLLGTAKHYPALAVAVAGTLGCLVAIILDYALIGWMVNHKLIRDEIDDSKGFAWAQRVFGRAPFLFIGAAALLPVPFYPVKILAIARDYSLVRFCLALAVFRLPRFYLLALVGRKVQAPNSALASAAVALTLMAAWGVWRTYRRNRLRAQNRANQAR